jgi:hypothetical protein
VWLVIAAVAAALRVPRAELAAPPLRVRAKRCSSRRPRIALTVALVAGVSSLW